MTENPKSFWHFITNVCAIIGGVFTVGFPIFLQFSLHIRLDLGFEYMLLWFVSGGGNIGFGSAQHDETDEKD